MTLCTGLSGTPGIGCYALGNLSHRAYDAMHWAICHTGHMTLCTGLSVTPGIIRYALDYLQTRLKGKRDHSINLKIQLIS